MGNRWTRLCLALACALGVAERCSLHAQDPHGQPGLPPLSEPTPLLQPPAAGPGPIVNPATDPQATPQVDFKSMGLNAFEQGPGRPPEQVYLGLGARGLQRQALGHTTVSTLDAGTPTTFTRTISVLVNGQDGSPGKEPVGEANAHNALIPATVTASSSTFANAGQPFGDFHDVNPDMAWGFSGTLGYRFGDFAVEATGFYIFNHQTSTLIASSSLSASNPATITQLTLDQTALNSTFDPDRDGDIHINAVNVPTIQGPAANKNRLDLPFFNEPQGFVGKFQQVDHVNLTLQSAVGSGEVNYLFGEPGMGLHGLLGFRYVSVAEQFSMLTVGDPNPTALQVANYQTQTHNHVVAAQAGLEGEWPLCSWLGAGGFIKGAWGANFLDADVSLVRGDGLVGFQGHRTFQSFAQVYEMSFFFNLYCAERCRVHAGYNLLWMTGLANADRQVDFDLSHTLGAQSNHGSTFYSGPVVEVQIVF
jgi:hypothetical protein